MATIEETLARARELSASLALLQRPRKPIVVERVGLIRKLEDSWSFQIRERLDTGRVRTLPPIEVYSLVEAAMEHDVVLVTDTGPEITRCPVLRTPIRPEAGVYEATACGTSDVIGINRFAHTRLMRRATVEN